MKADWKYVDFNKVFPIKMGKTPPRGDTSCWDTNKTTNNKWVSIADISANEGGILLDTKEYITDTAAAKIFKAKRGSLLMSFKLSIGKMAFAGVDLFTNEAIIAIPESPLYNLRFLYYYISGYDWKHLTDGADKVKGKTLNKESIGRIQLPVISLSEQGEIVAYLDKEFALIDALREKATLQLQAAKDLFQSVYDSALSPKQSWCFKKLKDVAIYRRGSFPQPYGNTEWYGGVGEMPFVQVAELQEDNLNLMFPTRKNISKLAQPMSVFVPAGSVLVSLQGSIGKVAISQYDSYVDRTVAIFFDYKEKMDKTFFAYSLKRKFAEERLKARGTTIKTITKEEFAEFSIPLPTLSEQEEIVRKLDALSEKCRQLEENYRQTITLCNDLKQALLRQVFE